MPLQSYFFLFITLVFFSCRPQTEPVPIQVDTWIRGGSIVDGSGTPPVLGDLGILHDTIAFIGIQASVVAGDTIEASGYMVTPGFIDPHTHALGDLSDSNRSANLNYIFQGVTTVITGNDGGGPIETAEILSGWEKHGIGPNAGLLAGHNSIRRRVMGTRKDPPTEEELQNMKTLVTKAMQEGAFGLSSGLYYVPASYCTTEEVIELAKIAAAYGGIYDAHMRDESSYSIGVLNSVREMIRIAEKANIPSHMAHLKALGADVWGKSDSIVLIVEEARARGLEITADQYPYNASGSSLSASLVPSWVFADGGNFKKQIADKSLREKIITEMTNNLRRRGGAEAILFITPSDATLKGLTLAQVSEKWNMPPVLTAVAILENGDSGIGSFNMKEQDIVLLMQQPWVMTGSDGSDAHPRKYGTFPRKIKNYVLQKKVLTLPEMVHRSTQLTAESFNIPDRGLLKPGYFADIIVFKPEEVKDAATFEEPEAPAQGMHYVLVNGVIMIEQGKYTGALAGKALRR